MVGKVCCVDAHGRFFRGLLLRGLPVVYGARAEGRSRPIPCTYRFGSPSDCGIQVDGIPIPVSASRTTLFLKKSFVVNGRKFTQKVLLTA